VGRRVALAAVAVLAVAACGCGGGSGSGSGGSSEDADREIRAVVAEFARVRDKQQWRRACELLTPRAAAQLTALVGGGADDCETGLRSGEPDDDQLSPARIAGAAIEVRGDRALFAPRKNGARTGLRDVDGQWRIDNVLNPSLEERPRRIDPGLSEGSDEQQVRATLKAVTHAFRDRDYDEVCGLFGYGAEAQLFVAVLFTAFADSGGAQPALAKFTCPSAIRRLEEVSGDKDAFIAETPSDADIAAARISIRGERATARFGTVPAERLVRQDGHWLVGPSPEGFTTSE